MISAIAIDLDPVLGVDRERIVVPVEVVDVPDQDINSTRSDIESSCCATNPHDAHLRRGGAVGRAPRTRKAGRDGVWNTFITIQQYSK